RKIRIQRSSVVERSAVNRLVVGSNPTAGAKFRLLVRTVSASGGSQTWPLSTFFVYVLQNPDGKLYIGQTDYLRRRTDQHNGPAHTLTRTTKRFRGPWKLVYLEEISSRSAALAREKALKSGQGRAWLKGHVAVNPP